MKIEVLGPGCARCKALAANAEQAAKAAGVDYTIEKVTDMNRMVELGVMLTPALVVDGEVKSSGKVVSADEIRAFLG